MAIESGSLRRPLSLALRITLIVGAATTVSFVAFALLIARSLEHHFLQQDLGELQAVAESLTTALSDQPGPAGRDELRRRLAGAVAGHHGVYFSVFDEHGQSIYGTAPEALVERARATAAASVLDASTMAVWQVGGRTYRSIVLGHQSHKALAAISMQAQLEFLQGLRRSLWWGAAAGALAAVLAVLLAVRWGHAPMRRISKVVAGVNSAQLHVRLDASDVPIELAPLVGSFNGMLDQLQESFERLTHFSADIAHELRTPVTNLTTETQVALSKPRSPEAYREVLYSNLEELERMGKTIGDMLFLAQAEHPLARPAHEAIDLDQEVTALFEYFEAWADEAGVRLAKGGSAPPMLGDRLMLRRALANLIGNALRYAPKGATVSVRMVHRQGQVEISVENPGPDIATEHLPHLFDRFYRADPSRRQNGAGAGLGLSIVKSIAEAHGGMAGVASTGGLTRFWLNLPVAQARR